MFRVVFVDFEWTEAAEAAAAEEEGGGGKKITLPELGDVYAGWGNFQCKLSRRFGHQFSQSDCFIVTSCSVWSMHTHLTLRRFVFSEQTEEMILQVFQQNNQLASACHSNAPGRWGGGCPRWALAGFVRERMGVDPTANILCFIYFFGRLCALTPILDV